LRDNTLPDAVQDEDRPLSPEQLRRLADPKVTRRATVRPVTDQEIRAEFPWLKPADRCRDEKQLHLRRLGDDIRTALRGLKGACTDPVACGLAADVAVEVGWLVESQRRNARTGTVPRFDRLLAAAEGLDALLDPQRLTRVESDVLGVFHERFREFRA